MADKEIPLCVRVDVDENDVATCSTECPFFEGYFLESVAECNLFGKPLRPKMSYRCTDGFYCCDPCEKLWP